MLFLNEYGELESGDTASWATASGVSALGILGGGLVLIVSLSDILFMFLFKNISVSSFSPDNRKWASGTMSEATAEVGAAKMEAYGVDTFLRVRS